MRSKIIVEAASFLTILLFFYTGINKIIFYRQFELDVSQALGWRLGPIVAIIIPTVEILITIALLIPKAQNYGLLAGFILMTVFTIYVGYMLMYVPPRSRGCSCGGIMHQLTWKQHLYFNAGFSLLLAIALMLNSPNRIETKRFFRSLLSKSTYNRDYNE